MMSDAGGRDAGSRDAEVREKLRAGEQAGPEPDMRSLSGAGRTTGKVSDQARRDRLAQELRANLRKRKALAKSRKSGAPNPEGQPPDSEEPGN